MEKGFLYYGLAAAFVAAALTLVSACSKDGLLEGNASDPSAIKVSLAVELPSAATKSVVYGNGDSANRCIVEAFRTFDGQRRLVKRCTSVVVNGRCNFNFTVGIGPKFDFLFWADCSDEGNDLFYDTSDGLEAVRVIASNTGNDDRRDAFFASINNYVFSNPYDSLLGHLRDTLLFAHSVVLRRPFAQLNVISDDLHKLFDTDLELPLIPEKVGLSYKAPNQFNVRTGKVSGETEYSFTKDVFDPASSSPEVGREYVLCMDYILAPEELKYVSDIGFGVQIRGGKKIERTFDNIPLERRFKTNIRGSILTTTGSFNVSIDNQWNQPEFER